MMTSNVLSIDEPGEVCLVEEKLPDVPEGGFLVETVYSGVSAGTELTFVKGTNPYLTSTWDPSLGLFLEGSPSVAYPVRGIGPCARARWSRCVTGTARRTWPTR
jgi:hypothetical protein